LIKNTGGILLRKIRISKGMVKGSYILLDPKSQSQFRDGDKVFVVHVDDMDMFTHKRESYYVAKVMKSVKPYVYYGKRLKYSDKLNDR